MNERTSTCRACGAALFGDADTCPRCGARTGDEERKGPTLIGPPPPPGKLQPLSPDAPTQGFEAQGPPDEEGYAPGHLFLDHYRVVRRLGKGGMGAVYLARDDVSGQEVAVKVLPPALAREREVQKRFIEEARALAQLDHPAIVPLVTFSASGGEHLLVMKYIEGEPLDARIRRLRCLSFDEARRVFRSVVEALGYAHARGVIHRDVKPANVLLAKDGRTFLVDFGIAKKEQSACLTQTGMLMGTPQYMSPEQIRGADVDGRSDLYAAGLVLFEMLTGQPPFEGDKTFEILRAHVDRPPPDPRALRGEDIPDDLLHAVFALLKKDPGERPPNAEAVLSILDGELPDEVPFASAPAEPAATPPVLKGPSPDTLRTPVSTGPQTRIEEAFFEEEEERAPRSARRGRAAAAMLLLAVVGVGSAALLLPQSPLHLERWHAEERTEDAGPSAEAPAPTEVLLARAQRYLDEGQRETAFALLRAAVDEAPDHAGARLLLARAQLDAKRPRAAQKALAPLVEKEGLSAEERAELEALTAEIERALAERAARTAKRAPDLPTDIPDAELRRHAGRTRVQASNCYTVHALRDDPRARGEITLEVKIEQSGEVSEARVVHQNVGGEALARCLLELARSWRFPRFRETPAIFFQYTMAFEPPVRTP